jgi:hypothetical protein
MRSHSCTFFGGRFVTIFGIHLCGRSWCCSLCSLHFQRARLPPDSLCGNSLTLVELSLQPLHPRVPATSTPTLPPPPGHVHILSFRVLGSLFCNLACPCWLVFAIHRRFAFGHLFDRQWCRATPQTAAPANVKIYRLCRRADINLF